MKICDLVQNSTRNPLLHSIFLYLELLISLQKSRKSVKKVEDLKVDFENLNTKFYFFDLGSAPIVPQQ